MEKQYLIFVTAFAFWFALSLMADWGKRKFVVAKTMVKESEYWAELFVLYTNYNPTNTAHNKQISTTKYHVVFDTKKEALEYIKCKNFNFKFNEIKLVD